LLELEEERELARRVRERGDAAAMSRLTTSHLRLVAKVARRYSSYGPPISELIAEGNLGMVRAVMGFDPDRGSRLSTFAVGGFGRRSRNTSSAAGPWSGPAPREGRRSVPQPMFEIGHSALRKA
jgi:hypothetical protein